MSRRVFSLASLVALSTALAVQSTAQVRNVNGFTVFNVQTPGGQPANVDFVHAKPMQLPINYSTVDQTQFLLQALVSTPALGTPGHSSGAEGTGTVNPVFLGTPAAPNNNGITPQDFGTDNHPFSTARADLNSGGTFATNTAYPYRSAGKLFFSIGTSSYMCSASLIKRGVVVTAAHCVANYGKSQFYNGFQFVPGYRNGAAPYGTSTVHQVWVKTAYYNGTDSCYQNGVICPDDVAVLILNTNSGAYVGSSTGWFGYGYGGWGFAGSQTHITQIGYPVGLDNGAYMERNDSSGFTNSTYSNDTIIGSNMDGGSSGGPWIVNFGISPTLTGETNGSAPNSNIVVGVTSWGYISTGPKEEGASPFTSNNIASLVNSACAAVPAACN